MKHTAATDKIIYDNLLRGAGLLRISRTLIRHMSVNGKPVHVSKPEVQRRINARGWGGIQNGKWVPEFTLADDYETQKPPPETPDGVPSKPEIQRKKPKVDYEPKNRLFMSVDLDPSPMSATTSAVVGLESRQCRWPVGEPGTGEFSFCCSETDLGAPYCREHSKQSISAFRMGRLREREGKKGAQSLEGTG